MEYCAEMLKLRNSLNDLHIHWEDHSTAEGLLPMERTYFTYNDIVYSVIHGFGSFGGYSNEHTDAGLLEIMDHNSDEVVGNLTADEVLGYLGIPEYINKEEELNVE